MRNLPRGCSVSKTQERNNYIYPELTFVFVFVSGCAKMPIFFIGTLCMQRATLLCALGAKHP